MDDEEEFGGELMDFDDEFGDEEDEEIPDGFHEDTPEELGADF